MTFSTVDTADRELVVSRVIRATPQRIFEAFTDPKQMPQWWGPTGFTTTMHAMDVRVGGESRYTMHGPDGKDWPNRARYTEVVPGERLSYWLDDGDDAKEKHMHATVTFTPEEGGTRVTIRMIVATAAIRETLIREVNALEGGKQTLGRLAAWVEG